MVCRCGYHSMWTRSEDPQGGLYCKERKLQIWVFTIHGCFLVSTSACRYALFSIRTSTIHHFATMVSIPLQLICIYIKCQRSNNWFAISTIIDHTRQGPSRGRHNHLQGSIPKTGSPSISGHVSGPTPGKRQKRHVLQCMEKQVASAMESVLGEDFRCTSTVCSKETSWSTTNSL